MRLASPGACHRRAPRPQGWILGGLALISAWPTRHLLFSPRPMRLALRSGIPPLPVFLPGTALYIHARERFLCPRGKGQPGFRPVSHTAQSVCRPSGSWVVSPKSHSGFNATGSFNRGSLVPPLSISLFTSFPPTSPSLIIPRKLPLPLGSAYWSLLLPLGVRRGMKLWGNTLWLSLFLLWPGCS